jgi:hypothetical protein
VAEDSLISDDLLRQLIGVGHVDLLVGIPTLNHGETIASAVNAVQLSFLTHFARQRTVLLHSDAGSTDDTVARVRDCSIGIGAATGSNGLRTTHRISTLRAGMPGRGNAVRLMFAAADLLQANTVVILDPDVSNITPQWIAALATPVRDRQVDFVAPMYDRQPADGLLLTQLLRPLIRGMYRWKISEPLAGEFGCSRRFVESCLQQSSWTDTPNDVVDLWITGAALAGAFEKAQAQLGWRRVRPDRPQPPLADLFPQVVHSAFQAVEAHADYWLPRTIVEEIPVAPGRPLDTAPAPAPPPDGAALLESFASDIRNLDEILRAILTPETLAAVTATAQAIGPGPRYPGPLWADTVGEFLLAYHQSVMRRDHIAQALLPLYKARVGSFLLEQADAEPAAVDAALEALCVDFERVKERVAEGWHQRT